MLYFDVLFPTPRQGGAQSACSTSHGASFGFKREADTVSLSQICSGHSPTRRYGPGSRHRASHGTPQPARFATWNRSALSSRHAVCPRKATLPRRPYRLRFRESLSLSDLLNPSPAMGTGFRFPGIGPHRTRPLCPTSTSTYCCPNWGLAEWRVPAVRGSTHARLQEALRRDSRLTSSLTASPPMPARFLDAGTGLVPLQRP